MKNATKHADALKSCLKKLRKEHSVTPRVQMEPLKALVRGAMSYDVTDARTDEAIATIEREYVDLNELRVATELEMQDLLGSRYPDIEKRVALITTALNAIFEKESTLSLDRIKTLSKRDARQFLRDLGPLTPFVEAYIMVFGLEGNAIPLDQNMADYLRDQEIAEPDTSVDELQKFLENHLKAEEAYEFYALLRQASATSEPKKKAKSKA